MPNSEQWFPQGKKEKEGTFQVVLQDLSHFLSFKSDVKQIWQKNEDLRSCNELTVSVTVFNALLQA